MFQHLFRNLLIHGEGGDGAGAAPGEAAPGAEASAVQTPVAGEMKPQKAKKYGRVERLPYEYGKEPPAQNQAPAQQQPQKQPWEEIEKLYPEEIGAMKRKVVQDRFKNQADNAEELTSTKAQLEKSNALLAQLAQAQFNIQPGENGSIDIAAIEKQLTKSRAEEYALENGVSEEFAEERLQMEAKLKEQDRQLREFQAAEEARRKDAENYAQFQKHRQQAEEFRQKMNWPDFDLVKEIESNQTFAHLLRCGVGVENAYFSAHHDELMAAQAKAASMQATRALSASIQAGQSMPTEGGLGRTPAANPGRVSDPKKWSKAMRADVRRRVERGEKIYL